MDISGFYILSKLFCKYGVLKSLPIIAMAFVLIVVLISTEMTELLIYLGVASVLFVGAVIFYSVKSNRERKQKLEELKDWVRTTFPDDISEEEVEREAKALLH